MVGAVTPVIEDTTGESIAKETEESPSADNSFEDAAQVRRIMHALDCRRRGWVNSTLYTVPISCTCIYLADW